MRKKLLVAASILCAFLCFAGCSSKKEKEMERKQEELEQEVEQLQAELDELKNTEEITTESATTEADITEITATEDDTSREVDYSKYPSYITYYEGQEYEIDRFDAMVADLEGQRLQINDSSIQLYISGYSCTEGVNGEPSGISVNFDIGNNTNQAKSFGELIDSIEVLQNGYTLKYIDTIFWDGEVINPGEVKTVTISFEAIDLTKKTLVKVVHLNMSDDTYYADYVAIPALL